MHAENLRVKSENATARREDGGPKLPGQALTTCRRLSHLVEPFNWILTSSVGAHPRLNASRTVVLMLC